MKKKIFYLLAGWILGPLVLILLFFNSQRINSNNNNFLRKFVPHFITLTQSLPIDKSYSIIGVTNNHSYLSTKKYVNLIDEISWGDKMKIRRYKIPHPTTVKFVFPRIQLDSPYFFIVDGGVPIIYKGLMKSWQPNQVLRADKGFSYFSYISDSSYAINTFNPKFGFVLGVKNNLDKKLRISNTILDKNQHSQFANDGMLSYNKSLKKVIYLYYHKNRFAVTDTNLNISYYGKTIDTVSVAKVTASKIGTETKLTSPSIPINRQMDTRGKLLYVYSTLMADNEDLKIFAGVAVIDIYNLENGKYKFSFYIKDHKGFHLRDFKVSENFIYGLFDNGICRYQINKKYLE